MSTRRMSIALDAKMPWMARPRIPPPQNSSLRNKPPRNKRKGIVHTKRLVTMHENSTHVSVFSAVFFCVHCAAFGARVHGYVQALGTERYGYQIPISGASEEKREHLRPSAHLKRCSKCPPPSAQTQSGQLESRSCAAPGNTCITRH